MTDKIIRRPVCPGCGQRGYFSHSRREDGGVSRTMKPGGDHLLTMDLGAWCPTTRTIYAHFQELVRSTMDEATT